MSRPLERQRLVDVPITPSGPALHRNFLAMAALFATTHGCQVSCLDLANARLGSAGVWQSGFLYASYTLSALYGASYVTKRYGSRNGLMSGMGLIAGYVTSFFLLSLAAEGGGGTGTWHSLLVGVSAVVGGIGSSNLWVAQGSYFTSTAQLYASQEGGLVEDATSRFGGNFAFVFLLFEVLLRVLSTFLIETAGLSWKVIFGVYALLSILPAISMANVMELEEYLDRYNNLSASDYGGVDDREEESNSSPSHKAAATLHLLRDDPKAKYLAPLTILFGLSTSFSSAVANGVFIPEVLSDPSASFVGLFTSITSLVAAFSSLGFGMLQSSNLLCCGKSPVMMIGILSYLAIAVQFIAYPNGLVWSRTTLLIVYIMLGVGRATYEGTLRGFFADLFPGAQKEGAFGSIILFSGGASTAGYMLSVTGALECNEESTYCKTYRDGSIHNVLVMETVIIVCAVIAIPAFWRAVWMFRREQRNNTV